MTASSDTKIIRQKDDYDRRLERNNLQRISSFIRKPLFEVQFLMICDNHLWRGDYREISDSSRSTRAREIQ